MHYKWANQGYLWMASGVTAYVLALNSAIEAGRLPASGRAMTLSTKKGEVCVIDEEDEWATRRKWHVHTSGKNRYFCTSFLSNLHVCLHSIILPPPPRDVVRIDVHHVDGDSLNNRRQNLCYATHADNITAGFARRRRLGRLDGDPAEVLSLDGQP